jgi:hypothetical protein
MLSVMPRKQMSKRPVRAASVFGTPAARSDKQEAEEYLRAAREKVAIAERQLRELKEAEAGLTGDGFAEALLGDDDNLRLIKGYGDAVIVELYGVFDAFACAVAYLTGFPNPDGAAFARLPLRPTHQPPQRCRRAGSARRRVEEPGLLPQHSGAQGGPRQRLLARQRLRYTPNSASRKAACKPVVGN